MIVDFENRGEPKLEEAVPVEIKKEDARSLISQPTVTENNTTHVTTLKGATKPDGIHSDRKEPHVKMVRREPGGGSSLTLN